MISACAFTILLENPGLSLRSAISDPFVRRVLIGLAMGVTATEQEHLNNVFGAHLHITSLRAHDGPGLELLQYLAPRDGRPIPIDLRPTDLAWWQIVLRTGNGGARSNTVGSSTTFADASKPELKPVSLPGNELGFAYALIISDPDGHHVELTHE